MPGPTSDFALEDADADGDPGTRAAPSVRSLTEAERLVSWLRLAILPIVGIGEAFLATDTEHVPYFAVLGAYGLLSVGALAWTYRRPVPGAFPVAATAVDLAALTALAFLSGSEPSPARLGLFIVPLLVAVRFRPSLVAWASAATIAAYALQAGLHRSLVRQPEGVDIAVVRGLYLVWFCVVAYLLSTLLQRRTARVVELSAAGQRLAAAALAAEERERQRLAEGLHDSAIQNLMAARHEIEDAAETGAPDAFERADTAIAATAAELREAIFELHPYVLDEAGLAVALRAAAERAAARGGFRCQLDLQYTGRDPSERALYSVARQLLANVVEHARASHVVVRLAATGGEIVLTVADDGNGFDPRALPARTAEGHIGIATVRQRIEVLGGGFAIDTSPGAGTRIVVRMPAAATR